MCNQHIHDKFCQISSRNSGKTKCGDRKSIVIQNYFVYGQSIFVRLLYDLQSKLLFRIIKYKETKTQFRVKSENYFSLSLHTVTWPAVMIPITIAERKEK